MSEIIVEVVEDEVEGGYVDTALGHAIVTEVGTLKEIWMMVRDAVQCYFGDGAGNVNLPYIGKIHAAGLKQADVQNNIETSYRDKGVYSTPIITISVQFDLLVELKGDVRIPQRVRYTPDLTLLGAIVAAGGIHEIRPPVQDQHPQERNPHLCQRKESVPESGIRPGIATRRQNLDSTHLLVVYPL